MTDRRRSKKIVEQAMLTLPVQDSSQKLGVPVLSRRRLSKLIPGSVRLLNCFSSLGYEDGMFRKQN